MAQQRDSNDGRGQVKDPQSDGRMKENRDDRSSNNDRSSSNNRSSSNERSSNNDRSSKDESQRQSDAQPGGQGRVKDPDHDGRLKENRDS